jgi:hypothetical protein
MIWRLTSNDYQELTKPPEESVVKESEATTGIFYAIISTQPGKKCYKARHIQHIRFERDRFRTSTYYGSSERNTKISSSYV